MTRVAVVIPNWNGRHLLATCLDALRSQTYQEFQIIVVDNGSTDGSASWLNEYHPEVLLIENSSNLGFAAAVNQGIEVTTSRFVVTLNNDTQPDPGWLAALVDAAVSDDRIGMCASKMLFSDQPNTINSTGICIDRAAIAWDRRGGEQDSEQEYHPLEVFGPCAGAALYRRAMLDEIGLFDTDFFAYLEDVDLAWRARHAGWRCFYVPAARVLHHHSATGVEGSPFKSFHLGRNKIWLIVKNYPFRQLWPSASAALAYDAAAGLYALLMRGDVHAVRGRLAAVASLPAMWQRRKTIQVSCRGDQVWLDPLEPPWRVPRRYLHVGASQRKDAIASKG